MSSYLLDTTLERVSKILLAGVPQGLKPKIIGAYDGTAKAVPFQNIFETRSRHTCDIGLEQLAQVNHKHVLFTLPLLWDFIYAAVNSRKKQSFCGLGNHSMLQVIS